MRATMTRSGRFSFKDKVRVWIPSGLHDGVAIGVRCVRAEEKRPRGAGVTGSEPPPFQPIKTSLQQIDLHQMRAHANLAMCRLVR